MGKSFEIEGKLKVVDEVQSFASGFTKREFVVEVEDGKYPQMIKFECVRDKTTLTDGFSIDDAVKVTFDIRGNEYKERFYVNLNAWKLEKAGEDDKTIGFGEGFHARNVGNASHYFTRIGINAQQNGAIESVMFCKDLR